MTFDDARNNMLVKLRKDCEELIKMAGDKEITNKAYRPLRELQEEVARAVEALIGLNAVEHEASRQA